MVAAAVVVVVVGAGAGAGVVLVLLPLLWLFWWSVLLIDHLRNALVVFRKHITNSPTRSGGHPGVLS